eukprot:m51a1_g1180 hypothetical protein (85) ;mRNA; f:388478-388900
MRNATEGVPIAIEDWQYAPSYFEDGSADGITNMLLSQQLGDFFIENCSPSTMLDRLLTWENPHSVALFEVDPADQAHPKELVRM